MSDSLSNKELVAAGHHLAKAMNSDMPIIDIAKMLSRLAERLDCTAAALRATQTQRDQLAVESAVLIKFIDDECYVYGPHDVEPVDAAIEKPLTHSTNAFLAEVRATAITDALEKSSDYLDTDCVMDRLDISYEDAGLRSAGAIELHDALVSVANQLRQGASA